MRNFALFNSVLADELVSLRLAHATAPEPQPAASHPRGRRRAAAAADCCPSPPQSLLPPTAVPPACRRLCVSIDKLTKLQLSSFIPTFHLFLSVEFLCNYHAIWAEKLEIMQ